MKYPQHFSKHQEFNLWHPQTSQNVFNYSDGTETENYIEACVRNAKDLGTHSPELVAAIRDWPSHYHFSPMRSNLLRPFQWKDCRSVLELGAGCGSLTRYLGENVPEVVAIEGSPKRALIAALRCQDLPRVSVICNNFQDTQFDRKFEIVTLIGVLEYSGTYINAKSPYQTVLELAQQHLTEEGIVILAIENQLGLKYFDGCVEEHTGVTYKGIEGYDSRTPMRTFGKKQLTQLLQSAGLECMEFLYPFPDYKLPQGVMKTSSPDYQNHPPFLYQWLSYGGSENYGNSRVKGFQEFLAAKELESNGLLGETANSFLVLAGRSQRTIKRFLGSKWLVRKYSVNRAKPYMTEVQLCVDNHQFQIKRSPLYPELLEPSIQTTPLAHYAYEETPFITGTPLMEHVLRASTESINAWKKVLQQWHDFLIQEASKYEIKKGHLPGDYVDCVPWNLMETATGELILFDREWNYRETLPIEYILCRGLIYIYHWLFRWLQVTLLAQLPEPSLRKFCNYCFNMLHLSLTESQWSNYLQWEWEFQKQTSLYLGQDFETYRQKLENYAPPNYPREAAPLLAQLSTIATLYDQAVSTLEHQNKIVKSLEKIRNIRSVSKRLTQRTQHTLQASIWIPLVAPFKKRWPFWKNLYQQFGWRHVMKEVLKRILDRLGRIGFKGFVAIVDTFPGIIQKGLKGIPISDDPYYYVWLLRHYPKTADLKKRRQQVDTLRFRPLISIVMPVYNPPERFLREALESVLQQAYPDWELCIADDASTKPYVHQLLEHYRSLDARIKVVFRQNNGHISQASNSALVLASGDYIALLDHDDLLTPHALYEVASFLNTHPHADMIYTDEDKVDERNRLKSPYFKPDWCPDSFLTKMYTCHLGVYRRSMIQQIGGFRPGYEGSQDYDLVLRFTEQTDQIFHIPEVLYHWRMHKDSTAIGPDNVKPYAFIAAEKALADAMLRRNEPGTVTGIPNLLGFYQIRYQIKSYERVSILIPTRDLSPILDRCLRSIFEKSTYPNYEVILIDNGSTEPQTFKLIEKWKQSEPQRFRCYPLDIPFNYSKLNNFAVSQSTGRYLLFLNNDTEVLTPDWIDAMVEQAQRPSIGAVGGLLLYPDGTIQHAGVVLGLGGAAAHSHRGELPLRPGYFGQVWSINNYSAVTAACLMCRREVFDEVGHFEEALAGHYNDVDLCLSMVAKGYHNVYLPHVKLSHHESKSRGQDNTPEKQAQFVHAFEYLRHKWYQYVEHDPCYSPHLTRAHEDYRMRLKG
ncbi:glycosyltransferase [Deltaproteobacteria bacterium TL4]